MAWIYDAMDKVRDRINTLAAARAADTVAIVPYGQERKTVPAAKSFWVTLHPLSDNEMAEPGEAYVAEYVIGVTVWIKTAARSESVVSGLSTRVADVRSLLRYSDLGGWGRVVLAGDEFGGGEYIEGEDSDNIYGYQFELTVKKQYTS